MSGVTHEVVTLQVGHYSNFVGTHWWNIQESSFVYNPLEAVSQKEINHDVTFREGQNLLGEVTFTPRLVICDLKGSLNTLKQDGRLYDLPDAVDDVSWESDITMHKSSSLPKNDFLKDLEREDGDVESDTIQTEGDKEEIEIDQDAREEEISTNKDQVFGIKLYNLDNSVQVWSDYLRIHLHPRTVHIVENYQHNRDLEHFDLYGGGQDVFKDHKSHRDLEDRLHFFIEECDHLQGLHILADTHNGFGGYSASLVQELQDEFDNKSLMVFGISPPSYGDTTATQDAYRLMSMALTYEKLSNHSSAFIPFSLASSLGRKPRPSVALPYVDYQVNLPYHTSAILAASLDTATLPYRLERPRSYLSHLTQAMTLGERKVLGMYSAFPFQLEQDLSFVDSLLNLGDSLPWQPLTPGCHGNMSCNAQSVVARGIPASRLKGLPKPGQPRVLDSCNTLEEVMSLYLEEMSNCSLNAICNVRKPCKVTTPFPHLFSPKITTDGLISPLSRDKESGVNHIPMLTSIQATPAVGQTIEQLLADVKKIDIRKHHRMLEGDLEEDDYKESLLNLETLRDNYSEGGGDMV